MKAYFYDLMKSTIITSYNPNLKKQKDQSNAKSHRESNIEIPHTNIT